jgi:hypothetical protein
MTVYEEEQGKRLKDVKDLMDTALGRRFIFRQLESCCVFQAVYNTEHGAMAFNEGKRNAALPILADVFEAAPKKFQVMMLEAKENRDRLQQRLEREQEKFREDIDE